MSACTEYISYQIERRSRNKVLLYVVRGIRLVNFEIPKNPQNINFTNPINFHNTESMNQQDHKVQQTNQKRIIKMIIRRVITTTRIEKN